MSFPLASIAVALFMLQAPPALASTDDPRPPAGDACTELVLGTAAPKAVVAGLVRFDVFGSLRPEVTDLVGFLDEELAGPTGFTARPGLGAARAWIDHLYKTYLGRSAPALDLLLADAHAIFPAQHTRLVVAYRTFVADLHRALAEAPTSAVATGIHRWDVYPPAWPGRTRVIERIGAELTSATGLATATGGAAEAWFTYLYQTCLNRARPTLPLGVFDLRSEKPLALDRVRRAWLRFVEDLREGLAAEPTVEAVSVPQPVAPPTVQKPTRAASIASRPKVQPDAAPNSNVFQFKHAVAPDVPPPPIGDGAEDQTTATDPPPSNVVTLRQPKVVRLPHGNVFTDDEVTILAKISVADAAARAEPVAYARALADPIVVLRTALAAHYATVRDLLTERARLRREFAEFDDSEFRQVAAEEFADTTTDLVNERTAIYEALGRARGPRPTVVFIEMRPLGDRRAGDIEKLRAMYFDLARRRGWTIEEFDATVTADALRKLTLRVAGPGVDELMLTERGQHRFFDRDIKTGVAITRFNEVLIYPEVPPRELNQREQDFKVETMRAGGAGGQHVNTTDSAVRVRHVPSGLEVKVSARRSQHANKALAYAMLYAKLREMHEAEARREVQKQRYATAELTTEDRWARTYVIRGKTPNPEAFEGRTLDEALREAARESARRALDRLLD